MSETGQYLLYVLSNIFGGRCRKCPGYDIVGVSGLEVRLRKLLWRWANPCREFGRLLENMAFQQSGGAYRQISMRTARAT